MITRLFNDRVYFPWTFMARFFSLSFFAFFILFSNSSRAQTADSTKLSVTDTTRILRQNGYIESMHNYLSVKLALSSDIEDFSVKTDFDDYFLYPNTSTISRLFINYRILSFSIKYIPLFLSDNNDVDEKGKTKSGGLGFNITLKHWQTEVSYSSTKGYYLDNTNDFVPGWTSGDPYIQFPKLVTKSFSGSTSYSFNPKFSTASIFTQTERQLKNAGSFIPKLAYRFYIVDNQEPVGTTQKSNNFLFTLGAGYQHNFVIREKVNFSFGLTPSVGFVFTRLLTRYPTGDVTTKSNSPIYVGEARGGLGYNGRRLFYGAFMTVSSSSFKQELTTAINDNTRVAYQVFLGYRFKAPRILRVNYDRVNEKVK